MKIAKIRLFVLIGIVFLVFSCKKELINDDYFVRNLSNDNNFNLPLHNESLMIFINKGNTVYVTSLRQLYFIKENNYGDFKNFDDFLVKALNKNLLSKSDLINNSEFNFKLNETISNEFKVNGLDGLKSKYCESSDFKDKFYLRSNLSPDIKKSIMYFFFKMNYYIMQNDYSGKDVLIDKNFKK
ncbi:hypothetical protein [Flavobacterium seoulense]|uniref:Lipoprotein n=1 Tax=Flavobacterium seoulense TaxID=1492738 RepID=A0A066WUS4_9FLAO|nr:hypothetical protein [Flavobacterium seoulense]KDN54719.1 hypothetical protein FEM21_22330 [Flavobacterium seoulense]